MTEQPFDPESLDGDPITEDEPHPTPIERVVEP
jgi:hypothetical protein